MKLIFPYEKEESKIFGKIRRPVAQIEVWSLLIDDWVKVPMIVDTGADYTLFPRYTAFDFGIDLKKDCQKYSTFGVGGEEVVYIYRKNLPIRLGEWGNKIPVGFLGSDDVPPLLGRLRCLDRFDVLFSKFKTYLSA